MQSVEFTEEHKSKLLEMCKELFSEYTHIQFRNYYSMSDYVFQLSKPDGSDGDGFDAIEFLTEKGYQQEIGDFDGKGYSIHWFEFCMTHLLYKIYPIWKHEDVNCITDFHLDIHNYYLNSHCNNEKIHDNYQKYHPINYLYDKYKELQKLGYKF